MASFGEIFVFKVYHSFRKTGKNDRITGTKKEKKGQGVAAQDISMTKVV
jgi:hypothetical protein